eukprot:TRINITY_DN9416_c0_g2_i1.p1 TRINITY_DN9416_c0_g2~~TRINITY_DN9416_c0_g2_i1.p1  ORF type:complete len:369 (+),score=53.05 TRINITY_DN9416_c0_g2_i1:515-1621(+)
MTGGIPLWKNGRPSPTKRASSYLHAREGGAYLGRRRNSVRNEAGIDLNNESGIKDIIRAKKDGVTYSDPTDGIEITISSAPGGCRYYVAGNARPIITVSELRRDDTGMFLYFPELEKAVAVTARVLPDIALLFDKCDVKHNIERRFYLKQIGIGYTNKGFSLDDKRRCLAEAEERYQRLVQQQNMELGLGVRIHHSPDTLLPIEMFRDSTPTGLVMHRTHSVRQTGSDVPEEGSSHSAVRPASVHEIVPPAVEINNGINDASSRSSLDDLQSVKSAKSIHSAKSAKSAHSIKSIKSVRSVASSVPARQFFHSSSTNSPNGMTGHNRISPPRPGYRTTVTVPTSGNSMQRMLRGRSNSPTAWETHSFNY